MFIVLPPLAASSYIIHVDIEQLRRAREIPLEALRTDWSNQDDNTASNIAAYMVKAAEAVEAQCRPTEEPPKAEPQIEKVPEPTWDDTDLHDNERDEPVKVRDDEEVPA